MRQDYTFILQGGMDEVSQPLTIAPGRVLACANHEVTGTGYRRTDGFERFDGRASPTDFPFYLLDFTSGSTAILSGDTIVGALSGATGIVLTDAELTSGSWAGAGAGTIAFRTLTGNFADGEPIHVSGNPVAIANGAETHGQSGSGDSAEEAWSEAARDHARALINPLPGSGDPRGVWAYNNALYAFRDNSAGTECRIHRATASGWVEVALGHTLDFTGGGTDEIAEQDTVTGTTSGATATVERVVVQSGTWSGGDAAGYLVLSGVSGLFQAENIDVGSGNIATIAGDVVPTTLPPGGRYFFVNHNFYGASDLFRMYGCNGVGTAFEFDGTIFAPIRTGMEADTPTRIATFRNHLFLAYPGGSIQNSGTGLPLSWEAVTGAGEIGTGSEIADFIVNTDSLILLAENGVFALTGYDDSDFLLGTLSLEAGAEPYTAQRIGPGIYLDNRGLRSIETTQTYGNFKMGTYTELVEKTLATKRAGGVAPIASAIVRSKNHYRLFYSDGTGLSFYLGRKLPEPMYFNLGKGICCVCSNEWESDNIERIFFGANDGYVYQLDKGISFDGEPITAFIQLSYTHMGSPQLLKRLHKVSLEAQAEAGTTIGVSVEYDYSGDEQTDSSSSSVRAYGSGGLWGVANWGQFYWSAPVENVLDAWVDGQGRNVSIIIYSNSALVAPYTLRGATYYYSPRGRAR